MVAWATNPTKLGALYRDDRLPLTTHIYFTRSLDAGKIWSTPKLLYNTTNNEVVHDLAVSPEDSLYISISSSLGSFFQGMQFSSSSNGGATFSPFRNVYSGGNQFTRFANLETGLGGRT